MENIEILEKVEKAKKQGDDLQAWDIETCINNTQESYKNIEFLKEYAKKKMKKNKFDNVQFIKAVFNNVNFILENYYFNRYYNYNKKNVNVLTRWMIAESIAETIEEDAKTELKQA